MKEIPHVFQYIIELPPPSYRFAKLYDWLKYYVDNYRSPKSTLFDNSKYENGQLDKATDYIIEIDKEFDKIMETREKYTEDNNVMLACNRPYMVGRIVDEKQILEETKYDVTIVVNESITNCYNSQPIGRKNLTIPAEYFKTEENKREEINPTSVEASILRFEIRNGNL